MEPAVERELIRKCRAGDSRFYEPIVRAYERPALRLALGMLGNGDDARDAVQEAFVKAYDALARFDLNRSFGPWYFQILRNQCRDMLRGRRPRFDLEVLDHAAPQLQELPQAVNADPERSRERRAAQELLWRGLERIADDHREILVLKELEGLRYAEIASILEIPEGTVASRLFHARRALKDALAELGVDRAAV